MMDPNDAEALAAERNRLIDAYPFRKTVFDAIPEGSRRILDFGCNQGELLLRLQRDKNCRELYGLEVNEESRRILERHLDGSWILDLAEEGAELGDAYEGFFNYLILHDVVEHLYDPWFVLARLRKYLATEGQLVLVAPNFQYWGFIRNLLQGSFFYGEGGGLMNEDHIRWFTYKSLVELVSLAGFMPVRFQLLFPPDTDLNKIDPNAPHKTLTLPPPEVVSTEDACYEVALPADPGKDYLFFLANKLMLVCKPAGMDAPPERISVGGLARRRQAGTFQSKHSWS